MRPDSPDRSCSELPPMSVALCLAVVFVVAPLLASVGRIVSR